MRVYLSAVQAGNRSGTGRYTEELARALAARADLTLTVDRTPGRGRLVAPRGGYDVMHYPANFCPPLGGEHLVVTVHDLSFLRHPEWFSAERALYYRAAFAITRRRAARFIADSHATREDLITIANISPDKIDVAHLGVSDAFRPATAEVQAAARARYKLPEQFFLYVGTLEPRKNVPRLLQAFDAVAHEIPHDLVIAGREGWKVHGIQQALATMKHAPRVHFPGFIANEDLPALLSAASGFAWPSLFEGFGLPPLEALACGTPVLTSNTSSLPELFDGHALLVNPEDTRAIAEGLRQLAVTHDAPPESIAHAQSFTWEKTAANVATAYARVAP